MRKEMWLPVVGYEGRYEVSDRGRVRIINSKTMMAAIHHTGYSVVSLRNEGGRAQHGVHRLVAMAFLNNPLNKPAGELRSNIAREYGIDWSTADAIFRRRKWKHI